MTSKKKIPENELNPEIYVTSGKTKMKIIAIAFILITLGFIFNFPLEETIKTQTINALNSIRGCTIAYNQIEVSTFLIPRLTLKDVNVSGSCVGSIGKSLSLGDVKLNLSGPSFYPPGVKLHLSIEKGNSEIHAYPSLSFIKHIIKIQDTYISSDLFQQLSGGKDLFKGKISIEAKLELERSNIAAAQFLIKSSNFSIPPQSVMGMLDLPELAINSIVIKASILRDKLSIQEFVFGDESSPLIGNIAGKIRLNKRNFMASKPDLKGEIKFSDNFLREFSIIETFLLNGATPRNGFYRFNYQNFNGKPKFY